MRLPKLKLLPKLRGRASLPPTAHRDGGGEKKNVPLRRTASMPLLRQVIEFLLYADSQDKVKDVRMQLKALIDGECRSQAIDDANILKLSERTVEEIKELGRQRHVAVEVDKTNFLPRIKVTGPAMEGNLVVADVKNKLAKLREMEVEADKFALKCKWSVQIFITSTI